ncbi:unnamed protein product [Aspergillus oryzae var. brunneus]|uniref:Unnamed protein product n=1 Tax=Aspergillus oryzae var. brunneus TaxID=332754 RepID=A0ABQ6KR97_ASPOZ|nr:unnamed protein product [Aspergillus oryzae var. brunneus]
MRRSTSTTTTASVSDPGHPRDATIRPQVRLDGLPLIALPNNPTSLQLPHARARDILAFHQFLFRTMPILFPPASLSFWRDYVCQEAWGIEYVFDAVVALGCMHRATLLLSQQTESDRDHGFDTKVIAVQIPSIIPSDASAPLQEYLDFSPKHLLQQLLDIGSMDSDIKPLIWCPLLRFVTTALDSPRPSSDGLPFGCEALRVGLSPILFLAGQSCPRPTWLRWILFELDRSGREGVCNSKAFATSLEVLSTLEKRVRREPRRPDVEYFTPPHQRVISVIFPGLNGRGYVTYYAQIRPGEQIDSQESHIPLCIASWASSANGGRPVVTTCDGTDVPFSEWVMDRPLVKEWAQWLTFSEFDLTQTLHDHINGSRLLVDRDKVAGSKW